MSLNSRNTKEIIYKELSYKIVGLLFASYKELGGDYQEKYYQRALETLLQKSKIPFKREVYFKVEMEGAQIGKHFIDFVIDDKIALDLKKGFPFRMGDVKQILMYLKTTNLKLGMLAYISTGGVKIKRIINKSYQKFL